jgi:hypothetical protein
VVELWWVDPVLPRPDLQGAARSGGGYGWTAGAEGGNSDALAVGSDTPRARSSASEVAAACGASVRDGGRRWLRGRQRLVASMVAWLLAADCGA